MNCVTDDLEGLSDAAVEERLLQRMKQRTEEIALRSQQRRNERSNRNTELETADAFLASFAEMKNKLEQDLHEADTLTNDRQQLLSHFDKMVREHGLMQQHLNESTMFLAPFLVKSTQNTLADLYIEIQKKMEDLQPKRRFGFRSKVQKSEPAARASGSVDDLDSAAAASRTELKHSALDKLLEKNFFGFKDRTDETLVMEAGDILNRQLNLQNLRQCRVLVLGSPGTIQASGLVNCTVLIGPTSRSAFIKGCTDCRFVLACQQVRIHDTCDTHFYLHVTGAAIIESCRQVGFAPYNLRYPALEEHYTASGLDTQTNYWDQVEDFKWISKKEKSPNFYIIEEKDRKTDWL